MFPVNEQGEADSSEGRAAPRSVRVEHVLGVLSHHAQDFSLLSQQPFSVVNFGPTRLQVHSEKPGQRTLLATAAF